MLFASLCLLIATLANATANILMKKASGGGSEGLALYFSPWFIGGAALFGLNMLFYARALKTLPLAQAYPLLVGGSLLIVAAVAHFVLQEPITIKHLAGIALIMGGVFLVV